MAPRMLAAIGLAVLVGCQGPLGPDGEQGLTGVPGEQGEQGGVGPVGPDGTDGGLAIFIDSDTTWSSDLVVEGVAYVAPGAVLTIDPGVVVHFLPGGALYVEGSIIAAGTSDDKVKFQLTGSFPETILGLHVWGSGDTSVFDDVEFEGVDLYLYGEATPTISDATFIDANVTATDKTGSLAIARSNFTDTGRAAGARITLDQVDDATISYVTIDGGSAGLFADHTGDAAIAITSSNVSNVGSAISVNYVGAVVPVSSVSLSGVTADNTVYTAITLKATDYVLSDVTVSNVVGTSSARGISFGHASTSSLTDVTITDVTGDGLVASGTATVDGLVVERADGKGIRGNGGTYVNVTVRDSGSNAIDLIGADVSQCLIENNALGVRLRGGALSSCDVAGNTGAGVIDTPVSTSNLTGNGGFAVDGDTASGCYVADNNGMTGVDTGGGGQTSNTMINPQSTPVSGTGPQ